VLSFGWLVISDVIVWLANNTDAIIWLNDKFLLAVGLVTWLMDNISGIISLDGNIDIII
jgi:hypothetical protein